MATVAVSIPHLVVTKGREKNKEIYVTGAVTQQNDWKADEPIGGLLCHHLPLGSKASNGEEGQEGSQSALGTAGSAVFCSEVFHRVRSDEPLSLSGSGILVYPPADPGGYFGLYIAVMESDQGVRTAGEFLTDMVGKVREDNGLKQVLDDSAMAPLGGMARVIGAMMESNRDDYLLTHYHSGFRDDHFGLPPGCASGVHDFQVENDRVTLSLRVRVGSSPAKGSA